MQGNWMPYELKLIDVEWRLFSCKQLLERQKIKRFLHRIVTDYEKWIWNRGVSPAIQQHCRQSRMSMVPSFCSAFSEISWVYFIINYSNRTKPLQPLYVHRHEKVILQPDNARTHVAKPVKTYLETLKWEVLPHPRSAPDIAPSDYHLFRSMTHGLAEQHFHSYEVAKK